MIPVVAAVGSKAGVPTAGALTGGVLGAILTGGDLAAIIVGCMTGLITLATLVSSSRSKSNDAEVMRRDAELERLIADVELWRARAHLAELNEAGLRRSVLERELGVMRLINQIENSGQVPVYRPPE